MVSLQTLHRRAARVLPEVVQTSGVVLAEASERDLSVLLFPLRRRTSGMVKFRLTEEVQASMCDDPLQYLRQATQARQGCGRMAVPFAYGAWRKVHVPALVLAHALPPAQWPADALVEICFTVKTDGRALVLVAPHLGMAAYLWQD